MFAMFNSGFGYEPIGIGLTYTGCVRSLGAVLEQLSPRAVFEITLNSIGKHSINAPVFRIRGAPNASQKLFRKRNAVSTRHTS